MSSFTNLEKIRTVFFGSPAFALLSLEALRAAAVPLVAVVTQRDKPAGRGRRAAPPPVKIWAEKQEIPVYQPKRLKETKDYAFLEEFHPDLLVVVAYGKILPREILDIAKYGAVNVHASLLPKYRGPAPIPAAILGGEKETGITIMLLNEEVDSGPILAQERISIAEGDTAKTLSKRLALKGAKLLVATLKRWVKGEISPTPQDHSKATACKMVKKEDGRIAWSKPAEEIERMVRAYVPWPGAWTEGTLEGSKKVIRLKLHTVSVAEPPLVDLSAQPGEIYQCGEGEVAVRCGDRGAIILKIVQLQDRPAMDVQAFVRGHQTFIGSRLQ